MIQRIKDWLITFSEPKLKEQEWKIEQLQHMVDKLTRMYEEERDRRLLIDDLRLKPNQATELRNTSSTLRQALYDLGEHVCLTEPKECCRLTAIKLRRYYMNQTLNASKSNQIQSDRTEIDDINERRQKLFTRPNGINPR